MSRGSCTVFIGNIPYDATEEGLREAFGRAGTIASLRMVYDKDTRQPKGYAFCDYADPDMAMRAMRELSEVEVSGRRLRIDLADNAMRGGKGGQPAPMLALTAGPASLPPMPRLSARPSFPSVSGPGPRPLGPAPMGISSSGVISAKSAGLPGGPGLPMGEAGVTAPEVVMAEVQAHTEIAQTVAAMPQAQLQLCLGAMQRLAVEAPEEARAFLQDNPQLSYALLHAQLLLGLNLDPVLPAGLDEIQQLRAEALRRSSWRP